MKNLITISILLLSIPVFGQKSYIGIKAGPSLTNVFADDYSVNNDPRIGYTGGLTYEHGFFEHFNLELDLLYAQRGFKNDIIFTDQYGEPTGEVYTTHFDYDYLTLPIKGSFTFGGKLNGFVSAGIVSSFLTKAKIRTPGFGIGGFSEDSDDTDHVNRFDFGGIAEIGGSVLIKEQFKLFMLFAYQQSFTSIKSDTYYYPSGARHFGMNICLGFKYKIGR